MPYLPGCDGSRASGSDLSGSTKVMSEEFSFFFVVVIAEPPPYLLPRRRNPPLGTGWENEKEGRMGIL